MKTSSLFRFTLIALTAVCLLGLQAAQATTMITFLDSGGNPAPLDPALPTYANSSDYSPAGLNIGQAGYLFFDWNLGADSGIDSEVDESSWANTLPSWLSVDPVEGSGTYSFGEDAGAEAYSRGGVANWASITLPDGVAPGLSGALVDPKAENNSNNTIKNIGIGAGAPSTFLLHIVTDNTALAHAPVNRIRAREDVSGLDARAKNLVFNGSPDVYTFKYSGVVAGDIIKLQLNSGIDGVIPGIAGIMIDMVIPEPTSFVLISLGACGLGLVRRRV